MRITTRILFLYLGITLGAIPSTTCLFGQEAPILVQPADVTVPGPTAGSADVTVPTPINQNDSSEKISSGRVPWSDEIQQLVARWPMQHGGRVKPFDTFAGFSMLKINGKRSLSLDGERIGPIAWALDCMLYPEIAKHYECILISNAEVLTAIGFETSGRKRRAHWSYNDLLPILDSLFRRAQLISENEPEASKWTLVQRQTIQLAQNIRALEDFFHSFDTARHVFPLDSVDELKAIFGDSPGTGFSAILTGIDDLETLADRETLLALPPDRQTIVVNALQQLQSELLMHMQITDRGISWYPPEQKLETEEKLPVIWTTASAVIQSALAGEPADRRISVLNALESLPKTLDDRIVFQQKATVVLDQLSALAQLHDQHGRISMEVSFYRMDYFYRALICFMLAFVVAWIGWLKPDSRLPVKANWLLNLVGLALLVTGVVIRCIIQGRPPVTTLYETILFITSCCVITALVMEFYDRRRIALTVASFLGALGCFLSMRYELKEAVTAGDTMPSLVAVLDTNFWLSTHVTSVTLGYSAGLLAAAIAHIWLIGKLLGIRKNDKDFYRSITRMVYGTICFGLFFSIVGTILGGIWANYSWGRFWGWDPKENGALMICLAELMILHARMGGFIRDHGLHILALMNGMVVAFSWWGVNLLGVGLHSYGFTDGILVTLLLFYAIEGGVVLVSLIHRGIQRKIYSSGGPTTSTTT